MTDLTSPSRRRSPYNGRSPLSIDPVFTSAVQKPPLSIDDLYPPEMSREKPRSVDVYSVVFVVTVFLICTSSLSSTIIELSHSQGTDPELRSPLFQTSINHTTMEPRGNTYNGNELPSKRLRTHNDAESLFPSEQKGTFTRTTKGQHQLKVPTVPNPKRISIQRKKPEELKLPTPIMVMGMMKVRKALLSATRSGTVSLIKLIC
jgi:hypothetical protein